MKNLLDDDCEEVTGVLTTLLPMLSTTELEEADETAIDLKEENLRT